MKPRLQEYFETSVSPELKKEFNYDNSMRIPRLKKILVSVCLKEATSDMKILDKAMEEVGLITGQKPKLTRAKKSIAGFKLREGMPLGCVSTMRGKRMYEFYDRLVNIALPRVRDFRGMPRTGFDKRGNYSMGLKEQTIFPELEFDQLEKPRGMNITFVTSAQTDAEARKLLELMGFPFRKDS